MCQKWAEEGRKINDYKLSLPSFFLFPFSRPANFFRAFFFRVFSTIWESGTG